MNAFVVDCADIKVQGSSGGYLQGPPLKIFNLPGYPVYQPSQN